MAKKRRNRKVIPFQHERTLTYNKAKPNRQARRLGIKPEEPKREEKKTVSKAAVLSQKAKQARETQRRITPPGMTYGEYMEYLKYRFNDKNQEIMNKERGIMRKISSLKSFYNYFYRNERIKNNPAALVRLPKIHEKEIIRLDVDEVALLLDEVEQGENLTEKQKAYHNKTKLRDLAIMTLLLGTGIRVSECVGLNIADIDFKNGGIRIYRKGGKEVMVYFGTEVEEALLDYLEERDRIIPETGSEDALFLSLQKKRMAVRSVENLVKKYARTVAPLKPITPHKLRSTYGTSLYRETGDIYLVADVLGHSDVNTTKRHYAALEDERRRSARNKVQLRESGGKK